MKWNASKGVIIAALILMLGFGTASADQTASIKLMYEAPTWVWNAEGGCPAETVCDSTFKVEVWGKSSIGLNATSLAFRFSSDDDSAANYVTIDTMYFADFIATAPLINTSSYKTDTSSAETGDDTWTYVLLGVVNADFVPPIPPLIPASEDYVKWATIELTFKEDSLAAVWDEISPGGFDSLVLFFDSTKLGGGGKFLVTDIGGQSIPVENDTAVVVDGDTTIYSFTNVLTFENDSILFKYTRVEEINPGVIPSQFELAQNYPNPFNPETKIEFAIPSRSHVSLSVYNMLGQKVTTLVDEELEAGWKSVTWNSRDDGGNQVATGVYLYRLEAGDIVMKKKMMLLK
jgi:hypothetical protein